MGAASSGHEPGTPVLLMDWSQCAVVGETSQPGLWAWGLTADQAGRVARSVTQGQWQRLPQSPWMIVVAASDGSCLATASTAYQAGVFWTRQGPGAAGHLCVGPFLGAVVQARTGAALNDDFAAAQVGLPVVEKPSTPFAGVHRVAAGTLIRWPGAGDCAHVRQWCGPQAWGAPTVSGQGLIQRYRDTAASCLQELVAPTGPLTATMSGGLDSTFVVATLVHIAGQRTVDAYVHSPRPEAAFPRQAGWDPDDFPVALAMQRRYPRQVRIDRVFTSDDADPLREAALAASRLWYPPRNVFNHLWLRRIDDLAHGQGATRLFFGSQGNPAFSDSHVYAARYHARRREWADLAELARPYDKAAVPGVRTGLSLVGRQLVGGRRRGQAPPHRLAAFVPQAQPQRWLLDGTARTRYLRWLSGADQRMSVLAFAGWRTQWVDPFATSGMLDLAASIRPCAWARAGTPRGFARLVGADRVPDEIRLRTRKGGQSGDAWFTVHDLRSRFFDAADALLADPVLGPWVDADAIMAQLREWPWGTPGAVPPPSLGPLTELLAFGVAWRTLRGML